MLVNQSSDNLVSQVYFVLTVGRITQSKMGRDGGRRHSLIIFDRHRPADDALGTYYSYTVI